MDHRWKTELMKNIKKLPSPGVRAGDTALRNHLDKIANNLWDVVPYLGGMSAKEG